MARENALGGDQKHVNQATKTYRQIQFEAPSGSTEVLLVRHGESEAADLTRPVPLVDGRGDFALAEIGREQAVLIADYLEGTRIDAIYVTNLRRTEPQVEPALAEVHMGEWDAGVYRERVAAGDPRAPRIFEEERWDVIPGAESNAAIAARVGPAMKRIAGRHADERVVCFAHGGTIGAVLAIATGSRPFAFVGSDNGAISTLVVAGDRWILRGFNDRSHLEHHSSRLRS
jgi:probable phosphoglycerate mutase